MHLPKLPRLHGGHASHASHAEPVVEDPSPLTALFQKAVKTAQKTLDVLRPLQRQIVIGAAAVVAVAVACKTAAHVHTLVQRRRRRQLVRRCEHDAELYLFILPRSPWSPSLSPACTRVEAYLRANGIPYKAIETIDPTGSPSGELPFLVYKHSRVDQLPRIFEFLSAEFNVTMDDGLTREERALGAALRRTLEYSMERFLYRTVFIDHPSLAIAQIARALNISHLRARFSVGRYARKLRERLAITAYGALVSEQYENEFLLDCEALEAQIGEKRYLYSNTELTTYDCAVYALLVPFAYMGKYTALSPAYTAVADSTVLMGYIARISKRLFADVASRFDAADMSFTTSSSVSSTSCAEVDSEEVHRDVEVSEADTQSSRPALSAAAVKAHAQTPLKEAASEHTPSTAPPAKAL